MSKVHLTLFTDPACPWSWASEPQLRRLEIEFGDRVEVTFVLVGLARAIDPERGRELALSALDAAAESGMPVDARVFLRDRPASTHPASLALCAVAELGGPVRGYMRRLREAILLERRPCDRPDALVELGREVGVDPEALRRALQSSAVLERLGADLERSRAELPGRSLVAADPSRRVPIPSLELAGVGGVYGYAPYERWRELVGGGARSDGPEPSVHELLARGGRWAAAELAAASGLPRARVEAELWRLAGEWRARPELLAGGVMWHGA